MARLLQLVPGAVFAEQFRVVAPIAEGGMGAVYEVTQIGTGAARALKIMHTQLVTDDKLRQRFVQEAKVSALIESDHVVQVLGAGVDAETNVPWIAMELLRGETLRSFLGREGALAPHELRDIFSQLCHALAAAHDVGVVHRDLKPENIFLALSRREGVPYTVKVLDFGIAKLVADAQTHHTAAIGTPIWMAPEQTEVGHAVRPATDVWSLGLLAFHALTGMHYWRVANAERLSAAALMREVVLDDLVPASVRAKSYGVDALLPEGFDAWFARCVVRDPDARFQSAREARDALEKVLPSAPERLITGRMPALALQVTKPPEVRGDTTTVPSEENIGSVRKLAAASTVDRLAETQLAPSASPQHHAEPNHPGTDEPIVSDDASTVVRPISPIWIAAAAVLLVGGGAFAARALRGSATAQASPATSASTHPSTSTFDLPSTVSTKATKLCPPGMATLDGGTFFSAGRGDHVTVGPFCLDVTETTVAEYESCAKKGKCTDAGLSEQPLCNWPSRATKGKHPINCVDWDQASAFCAAHGKRLPTMEEWEWAAHGGDAGSTFPWGDEPPKDHLCWSGDVLKRQTLGTCEVKSHPSGASPAGVQDLAGNVAEWVERGPQVHESVAPLVGDHWVTESATFAKDPNGRITVASRLAARKLHEATIGFRCAKDP